MSSNPQEVISSWLFVHRQAITSNELKVQIKNWEEEKACPFGKGKYGPFPTTY